MNDLEIIEVPKENALSLFTKENGLDPLLEKVISQARSFVPDVSTKKGRESIASVAHKVSKSKVAIDAVGKDLVTELKKQPKLVDAERKRVRDLLDSVRDEVRKPLTDWEDEEKSRIEKIKLKISEFDLTDTDFDSSISTKERIDYLSEIQIDDSFGEFELEANKAKESALNELTITFNSLKKQEEEREELERLRKEQAEKERVEREKKIAQEAAEKAKLEAEQAAEKQRIEQESIIAREKEAAEKRELELKLASEKAEREKLEAQQKAEQAVADAKAEQEMKIQAEKQAAEDREADKKHHAKINNEALEDISSIQGITADQAKAVVKLIAQGKVRNVSINY